MISEIVVLPECFNIDLKQEAMNTMFNDVYDHPIFIIDFEGVNWLNYIRNHYLSKHTIADKDKFMRLLTKLKNSKKIFKRTKYDIEITGDIDWLNVSKKSHEDIGLNMVLTGTMLGDACKSELPDICENINNIVDAREKWKKIKAPRTSVTKNMKDYKKNFQSILMNSIELKIVDPYIGIGFTKSNKLKSVDANVLNLFSDLLGKNYSNKQTYIEIHTKLDEGLDLQSYQITMSDGERLEKVKEEYKKEEYRQLIEKWKIAINYYTRKYNHKYKVFFWADGQDNSFHDRYILTDILGINLGHSIAAKEDSKQSTRWHALNEYDYDEESEKYEVQENIDGIESYGPFIFIDTF